jgi:hypothetical protein
MSSLLKATRALERIEKANMDIVNIDGVPHYRYFFSFELETTTISFDILVEGNGPGRTSITREIALEGNWYKVDTTKKFFIPTEDVADFEYTVEYCSQLDVKF